MEDGSLEVDLHCPNRIWTLYEFQGAWIRIRRELKKGEKIGTCTGVPPCERYRELHALC